MIVNCAHNLMNYPALGGPYSRSTRRSQGYTRNPRHRTSHICSRSGRLGRLEEREHDAIDDIFI